MSELYEEISTIRLIVHWVRKEVRKKLGKLFVKQKPRRIIVSEWQKGWHNKIAPKIEEFRDTYMKKEESYYLKCHWVTKHIENPKELCGIAYLKELKKDMVLLVRYYGRYYGEMGVGYVHYYLSVGIVAPNKSSEFVSLYSNLDENSLSNGKWETTLKALCNPRNLWIYTTNRWIFLKKRCIALNNIPTHSKCQTRFDREHRNIEICY